MPEANSIPAASNPVGKYPDCAPGATPKPKLLERPREASRFRDRPHPPDSEVCGN